MKMKTEKCSICGKEVPSSMIGMDGRCRECLKKDGWV